MPILNFLPIFYGLAAALFWGTSDFAGGLASRRANAYRVLLIAEAAGLLVLLPLPFLVNEPLPPASVLLLSSLASVSGVIGLFFLYMALSEGKMSIAAPVSALLAAVVAVVFGAISEGPPTQDQMAGFLLALAAIWLISSGEGSSMKLRITNLRLPLLAGLTFGAYFVLMNRASQEATFWPLIAARLASTIGLFAYLRYKPQSSSGLRPVFLMAVMAGVLDVVANAAYVLAGQVGRLDVTAVLSSLYPGMTVLLAAVVLKEKLSLPQLAGIASALIAIVLITL